MAASAAAGQNGTSAFKPNATTDTHHASNPDEPPFADSPTLFRPTIIHPAAVASGDNFLRPRDEMKKYLELDLKTQRLNIIYRHLHYAGPPRFARPLHRQRLMGRDIVVTDNINEHLVWHRRKILVKPLSLYLLDYAFWTGNLCTDETLHKAACGFLLSYTWLVSRESDFKIAQDGGFLPADLEWIQWTEFITSFLDKIHPTSMHQIADRYQYGELRLSRLNRIYRYSPTVFSLRNLFRGYLSPSTWYQEFFREHFSWMVAAFAFFSVALSGMQVGLTTERLLGNNDFQLASYGFAVFTLIALATSIAAIILTWFVFTLYFYTSAKFYHHKVQSMRRRAKEAVISADASS